MTTEHSGASPIYRRPWVWVLALGAAMGLYMLGVSLPTLISRSPSEVRSEPGYVVLFIGLAALPYLILAVAGRIVRYERIVLILAVLLFALDVSARTSVIFFPQSSTDAIALIFLPFIFVGFAVLVWLIVVIRHAYHSAQAEERNRGS
jgi:hypothetical protein